MSKTLEQLEKRANLVLERLHKDGFAVGEVAVIGHIIQSKAETSIHIHRLHTRPLIQVSPKIPPGPKGGT